MSDEEESEIDGPEEVDLYSERRYVREASRLPLARSERPPVQAKTPYPGKTYNSEESIAEYFRQRGIPSKVSHQPAAKPAPPPAVPRTGPAKGPPFKGKTKEGATVEHPKYGRGTVLRKEGDGDDAKLTVMFPGHGLKKLIAKYAQLKNE